MLQKPGLAKIQQKVRRQLDECIGFWLENGLDTEHGGIYTCLDLEGRVYSTDKSVWMQGRAAWTFSRLCAQYGTRPEWVAAAKGCLDFLEAHCVNRAAGNRLYFTVTADGKPLRQRRYCFSEAFYCIANAEYYLATGDEACLARARGAYELVYALNHGLLQDPAGLSPKTIPETRSGRSLADPMIFLNTSAVMRRCDPARASLYSERAAEAAGEIRRWHHKPELAATLETVGRNGEFWGEISAGRVVNPGHSLECSWFLLEEARFQRNQELQGLACEIFRFAVNRGWDEQYGGLLYFTDVLDHPPESYEHDMKLWWPHNELLIAALMAWRDTGDESFLKWFEKGWHYAIDTFPTPDGREWYGYLHRDGTPTLPAAVGSTFKGPFHLPRMLLLLDEMLGELITR